MSGMWDQLSCLQVHLSIILICKIFNISWLGRNKNLTFYPLLHIFSSSYFFYILLTKQISISISISAFIFFWNWNTNPYMLLFLMQSKSLSVFVLPPSLSMCPSVGMKLVCACLCFFVHPYACGYDVCFPVLLRLCHAFE